MNRLRQFGELHLSGEVRGHSQWKRKDCDGNMGFHTVGRGADPGDVEVEMMDTNGEMEQEGSWKTTGH